MEKSNRSSSEESDSLVSLRHRCLCLFKGILDTGDCRRKGIDRGCLSAN